MKLLLQVELQGVCTYTEQGETAEADRSRMVGGRFNKDGNLHTRLVLGGQKMSGYLHQPARILKLQVGSVTGAMWSPQHIALSRLHFFKWHPMRKLSRTYITKTRSG